MSLGDLKFFYILVLITIRLWLITTITAVLCILVYLLYSGYAALGLLSMAIAGILYCAEDQLVYHPTLPSHSRVSVPRPSSYNLPYESIRCSSLDGTVFHMFLIKQANSTSVPTVVFFHGNAGNMGHRLQNSAGLYNKLKANILMVEYRGYGHSEGTPSERGLYMDAQAAINFLYTRTDLDLDRIVIFGRSLGGAIAIDLVAREDFRNKIWCMIVENTFTSIPDMAKSVLGWRILNVVPLICYKNKFMSLKKIKHVAVPSLFICGQADSFVPPVMGESLHAFCNAAHKKLARIPNGGHNDTWTCRGYYDILKTFLQETPALNKLPTKSSVHQV